MHTHTHTQQNITLDMAGRLWYNEVKRKEYYEVVRFDNRYRDGSYVCTLCSTQQLSRFNPRVANIARNSRRDGIMLLQILA